MAALSGHVIICGWGEKAFRIVRELHAPVIEDRKPVLLIADQTGTLPDEPAFEDVHALTGDPTLDETLHAAGVDRAETAIILADKARGQLADARSILIALAIESINPNVHTAVEVVDSANLPHFSRTAVNEIISISDLSEKLLAQAALNHGVTDFYQELLLFQENGNEFYRVALPAADVGRTFADLHARLLARRIIAIGVHNGGLPRLNPGADYVLREGDDLWLIAFRKPCLEDLD